MEEMRNSRGYRDRIGIFLPKQNKSTDISYGVFNGFPKEQVKILNM
jgi:hypothetical protein